MHLRLLIVSLVWLVSISLHAADVPAKPNVLPNILIVMTDDQGMGDFSCLGNPVLKTPNFDRFAQESVRLTDFHCCPMCSPTRGQLLTGLAALRNGATSVTAGRTFVRPNLTLLPKYFAQAGYQTGIFGKWHLGDAYPHRPIDKGFHESVYHLGWGMLNSTPEFGNPLSDGRYFHNGEPKKFTGHCTDLWFDQAKAWMKQQQQQGKPFLCYLPTNAPHAPHHDLDEFIKPYQGKGPAGFFGMIAHVDKRFGDLQTFLTESGLRDNTIVIFTTDNGGTSGVKTFNAGLRAGKTTYYDGGHRVPCWLRWPKGKLGEPRDIAVPTQNTDLLPTLLELAGLPAAQMPISDDESALFAGKSLAKLLRGEEKSLPDRKLVVQYGQTPVKFEACVLWQHWRLVKGDELYDVSKDREQAVNLAEKQPEVLKEMRSYYEKWWRSAEPYLNDFVPISIGAKQQPVVDLTSGDWEGIYADNTGHVRSAVGGVNGGHWHLLVEQPGKYEFTLRRWPEVTKTALGDKYEVVDTTGPKIETKAFPTIAQAKVSASGLTANTKANAKEQSATLTLTLPAGKTKFKAWFQDAQGVDLCGAFFVTVKQVSP